MWAAEDTAFMTSKALSVAERGKQPLVSVIMNCFNGQKYLRQAIDSVLAQTYQNREVIFWDNQSTDQSAEIFQGYTDPRLKYFLAPSHTLLYEARNHAIEKAEGEFIAFLDVDDWWYPEKLEKQVPLFGDPAVGFVCSKYWVVQEKSHSRELFPKNPLPVGWILNDLLGNYQVGLLTLLVRRSAFDSLKTGCDPRFHIIGDTDLVVRLAKNWKMDASQEALACYRIHNDNEGQRNKGRQLAEFEIWVAEIGQYPEVKNLSGYKKLLDELAYMKGRLLIAEGKRSEAIRHANTLPWGNYKIKLWICVVLPRRWLGIKIVKS